MPHRESQVLAIFGKGAVDYLKRKHRGGVSGAKGARFEDIFAVVKIAEYASNLQEHCKDVSIEGQAQMYFVDDLVIRGTKAATELCYQLKNSGDLRWGRGEKSIADDFEQQLRLSRELGYSAARVNLVVSDKEKAQQMQGCLPSHLQDHVDVLWFPWEGAPNVLCRLWPDKVASLSWLSKFECPDSQQISDLLTVLLGVWASCDGVVYVSDVIDEARRLSPLFLRPPVPDEQLQRGLRDEFKNALEQIDNFSYDIAKGFFRCEAVFPNGGQVKRTFPYDCLSEQFDQFQDFVIRNKPRIFDEIGMWLI